VILPIGDIQLSDKPADSSSVMANHRKTLFGSREKPPDQPKDPTKPKKISPAPSWQDSSGTSKTSEINMSATRYISSKKTS
jgi:hypothetical protein